MKRNIPDADGATIQTKIMISCSWFSGFFVVGASWAFWSDKIQFIKPIISYVKLLNILKLPFHIDDHDDDDDDDKLVNCMEVLLVNCSRAADIDNFWKYDGKYQRTKIMVDISCGLQWWQCAEIFFIYISITFS